MNDTAILEVEICDQCKKGNHYWCLSRYGVRCACFDAQSPKAKLELEQQKAEVKAQ